jgi:hypothetical protein
MQSKLVTENSGERTFVLILDPGEEAFSTISGWGKYEPAFQRWAAYNSMQYMARRDGAISDKEYAEREGYLDRWVSDQRRQGKLPSEDEIRGKGIQLQELMVSYQKHITRQETEKARSDRAYWTRIEDLSDELKENIDTERRYTRMLKDCAIAGAAAYGKSLDQVKGTSKSGSRAATSLPRRNIMKSASKAATAMFSSGTTRGQTA